MAKVRDDFEAAAPPRNDVYTGLLGISLGAMIIGCVLLFLDYSQYPEAAPKSAPAPVDSRAVQAEAAPTAATAQPAAVQPNVAAPTNPAQPK
jgi:hypothetical protein